MPKHYRFPYVLFGWILTATLSSAQSAIDVLRRAIPDLPPMFHELKVKETGKTLSEELSDLATFMSLSEEEAYKRYKNEGVSGGLSYMGFGASMSQEQFESEFSSKQKALQSSSTQATSMRVALEFLREGVKDEVAKKLIEEHYALVRKVVDSIKAIALAQKKYFILGVEAESEDAALFTLSWPPAQESQTDIDHVVVRDIVVNGDPVVYYDKRLIGRDFAFNLKRMKTAKMLVTVNISIASDIQSTAICEFEAPPAKCGPTCAHSDRCDEANCVCQSTCNCKTPLVQPMGIWTGTLVRTQQRNPGEEETRSVKLTIQSAFEIGSEVQLSWDGGDKLSKFVLTRISPERGHAEFEHKSTVDKFDHPVGNLTARSLRLELCALEEKQMLLVLCEGRNPGQAFEPYGDIVVLSRSSAVPSKEKH